MFQWFLLFNKETRKIGFVPVKIKGNKPYASWKIERLKDIQKAVNTHTKILHGSSNTALLTLTLNPVHFNNRDESWLFYKKHLSFFMRKLKRFGITLYMYNVEAHLSGYAHAHVLVVFDKSYRCFLHNKKLRNKEISQLIKRLWTWGNSDVVMGNDKNISNYLTIEVGKFFQIEDALKRADKGENTNNDIKALYTHYYSSKHNMRLFNCSAGLGKDKELKDDGECLDTYKNNSTEVYPITYQKLSEILGYKPPPYCNFDVSFQDAQKLRNYIYTLKKSL